MNDFLPPDFSFDLDEYPLIVPYDPAIHPRHSKSYPYPRVRHRRLTRDEFILIALWVHGVGRYDYRDIHYEKSQIPISITCPLNGVRFKQRPNDHLSGKGGGWKIQKGDTASWLMRLFAQHPEKEKDFDWSRALYKTSTDKIEIGCKTCGKWFWQLPSHQIRGGGCPYCRGYYRTTEESIRDFVEVHGDVYDYSKWEYKGGNASGIIICPAHGEFEQTYKSHRHGCGCHLCGIKKQTISEIRNMPEEEKKLPYFLYHVRLTKEDLTFDKVGVCRNYDILKTRFRYKEYSDFQIDIIAIKEGTKESILAEEAEILSEIWSVYGTERMFYDIIRVEDFAGVTECFFIEDYDPMIGK